MLGATVSAVAAGCDNVGGGGDAIGSTSEASLINHDLPIDFSFTAMRKEDFLSLRFDFVNLTPDGHHKVLQRIQSAPTFVIVNFPSQHVFEAAFFEGNASESPSSLPTPPVGSRLSGPSHIAFSVPDSVTEIPLTLDGLLELMSELDMHLAVNALPAGSRTASVGGGAIHPPPPDPLASSKGGSKAARLTRLQRAAFASKFFHGSKTPPAPSDPPVSVDAGAPSSPFNHETAVELPFRLLMSPDRNGAWAHAAEPVTSSSGRVELWHTRLGVRGADGSVDEIDPTLRKLRAIWTRDPGFAAFQSGDHSDKAIDQVFPETAGELETLTGLDRAEIVRLSSDFSAYPADPSNPDPLPRPVQANLMMLTSMGGWLDVKGDWPDTDVGLEEWEHRATLGRDHYVKVVFKGVLYPFGHRASLVKVSERKFKAGEHEHIAFLRQRFFIIIREPEKAYTDGRSDGEDTDSQNFRKLPFLSIQVRTLVTPNLDLLTDNPGAFVPKINGTLNASKTGFDGSVPFRFSFEAMDLEGNIIRFTAPVAWIPIADTPTTTDRDAGKVAYATLTDTEKDVPISGQRIAYAKSNAPDDTVFETTDLVFDAAPTTSSDLAKSYPLFFPVLSSTRFALEAVRQVVGNEAASRAYTYHSEYVKHGFGSGNAGELLLATGSPLSVSMAQRSDRSGGFLNPDFQLQGVSRRTGPVAGNSSIDGTGSAALNGNFKPSEFFGGANPLIFGVVHLTDILADTDLGQAPKYFTQILTHALGVIADLEKLLNDLTSVSFPSSNPLLPAIQKLLDDLDKAFDPNDSGQAAAAAAISGDVNAVVSALGGVSAAMPTTVTPNALQTDLISRAAALATELPGIVSDLAAQIAAIGSAIEFPKEIHTRLEWRGKVKAWNGIFVPNHLVGGVQDALLLVADIRTSAKGGGSAQIDLSCTLEDFSINLFGSDSPAHFLTLVFKSIGFRILNGKKPDVSVDLSDIVFAGPLSFIETLKKLIPLNGFSDPPNISVDTTGITAGFSIALPNIAVGVFSLENIILASSLRVPFIGEPLTFTFDFSTRDNPFNLTVALLGGGGFFGLEITPAGVQMLEASLEAGARLSIDLGVASGSVSAMIGVYFRIQDTGDSNTQVLLTGYFRIRGSVDVLGLITASITLSLELSYHGPDVNKLIGRASLEIEIDIAFFSTSVTVTCERRFAGSNGDPTFFEIMSPDGDFKPWNDYLEAFAA